jgi:hypothetical protein
VKSHPGCALHATLGFLRAPRCGEGGRGMHVWAIRSSVLTGIWRRVTGNSYVEAVGRVTATLRAMSVKAIGLGSVL